MKLKLKPIVLAVLASGSTVFTLNAQVDQYQSASAVESARSSHQQWQETGFRPVNKVNFIQLSGSLKSQQRRELSFPNGGYIREVRVSEGQVINKGDVLVALYDTVERAQVSEAKANLAFKEADLNAKQQLFKKRSVSELSVLGAKQEYHLAKQSLAQAERALRDRTLVSPFKAAIQALHVRESDRIDNNDTVLEIFSLEDVVVELPVANSDVDRVSLTDSIVIQLNGQEFAAVFKYWKPVSSKQFAKTAVLAVENGVESGWLGQPVTANWALKAKSRFLKIDKIKSPYFNEGVLHLKGEYEGQSKTVFVEAQSEGDYWLVKWPYDLMPSKLSVQAKEVAND